jgi:hypothetical protein
MIITPFIKATANYPNTTEPSGDLLDQLIKGDEAKKDPLQLMYSSSPEGSQILQSINSEDNLPLSNYTKII